MSCLGLGNVGDNLGGGNEMQQEVCWDALARCNNVGSRANKWWEVLGHFEMQVMTTTPNKQWDTPQDNKEISQGH